MQETFKSCWTVLANRIEKELRELRLRNMYRHLPEFEVKDKYVHDKNGNRLLNLASNDYLGLSFDYDLQKTFFEKYIPATFSSTSSRLMSGYNPWTVRLENLLANCYNAEAALVFNSGYHANLGIISTIADSKTIILADKLVHASIIDGILLSKAEHIRFRHNDMKHLTSLVEKYTNDYEMLLVICESTYSMDGDNCPLTELVELRKRYSNLVLYIDQAHDVGIRGENGLGLAEENGVLKDIDFLVCTFGKALAGYGAYLICNNAIKDYLINKARTFVFSTSLPPILMQWNHFIMTLLPEMKSKRRHLLNKSRILIQALKNKGYEVPSSSHIIPIICGSAEKALVKTKIMQENSFYALVVRPPTVPQNTCRVRISLNAEIDYEDLEKLIKIL